MECALCRLGLRQHASSSADGPQRPVRLQGSLNCSGRYTRSRGRGSEGRRYRPAAVGGQMHCPAARQGPRWADAPALKVSAQKIQEGIHHAPARCRRGGGGACACRSGRTALCGWDASRASPAQLQVVSAPTPLTPHDRPAKVGTSPND